MAAGLPFSRKRPHSYCLWKRECSPLLSGVPEEVTLLVGFYDGGRFVHSELAIGGSTFSFPLSEDIVFDGLFLYFLADNWQPFHTQRALMTPAS